MKKLLVIPAILVLTACQPDTADLTQYVQQVKHTTPVTVEPYPKFETQPAFAYDATALRSPFQRPKKMLAATTQSQHANCKQPNTTRARHPLEKYGLDALQVAGTMKVRGEDWALITANDGTLHKAKVGDHIGLFFGEITAIVQNGIKIAEMVPDGAGCWQSKQATLSMPNQGGETENV